MTLGDLVSVGVRRTATALAAVFTLAGCGGGDGPIAPPPVDHAPSSFIDGPSTREIGQSGSYACKGSDPDGDQITARTFTPAPQSQNGESATYVWNSEGTNTIGCTVTAGGKTSSPSTMTVVVSKLSLIVDAQSITPLGNQTVGEEGKYFLAGTPKPPVGKWGVVGNGVTIDSVVVDTLFATPTQASYNLAATITADGKSDTVTKTFTASMPVKYASTHFVVKKTVHDDGVPTEAVISGFPNGKTVTISGNGGWLLPTDSVPEGEYVLSVEGNIQTIGNLHVAVRTSDDPVTIEAIGGDMEKYNTLIQFAWPAENGSIKIRKFQGVTGPTLVVADDRAFDSGLRTTQLTGLDAKPLSEEDLVDIEWVRQNVSPVVSAYGVPPVRYTSRNGFCGIDKVCRGSC